MAEMGRYCKAYLAKSFAEFDGWNPDTSVLRPADGEDGDTSEPRTELKDDDILYIQEDFTVTDGIFLDEHVVFAAVDDEWKSFCTEALGFAIPDDVLAMEQAAAEAAAAAQEEAAAPDEAAAEAPVS